MAEHIYVGTGKEKKFQDGGAVISVSLTLDGMAEFFKAHGFTTDGGKKILKLKISQRREVDRYGNTHSVEIDTWKPSQPAQTQDEETPF
jgi:hypothetical protein